MCNNFLLGVLVAFFASGEMEIYAQKADSILVRNEEKLASLPYYSFGKGLGITSPDSLYQMNIRFRMQNRLTRTESKEGGAYQGMVRRLRLRLQGYVGDPKFQYAVQLSFSPEDVGALEEDGDLQVIRDAMFFYVPNDNWQFGFGQTKLPGNRQRINSSGTLQLTDRSINNSLFNIDRDFGIHAYYLANRSKGIDFNIKTAISTGEGRNFTKTSDTGLAYTSRLEVFPFGKFKSNGAYFEGDLLRESNPKVMLSATYHYNHNASRTLGQRGDILYQPKNIQSTLIDFIGKYKGWAMIVAYMDRHVNNPISYNINNPEEFNIVYTGMGYDTQLSYAFNNKIELIARYSKQLPNTSIGNLILKQEQYTFGVSKYIWEHTFKLQAEVSKNVFEYISGNENDWYLRFQIEIGI